MIDNIPSIRYDRRIVMIRDVNISKLDKIIRKYGADYESWKVISNEEKTKRLKLNKN
ncbi:MAG: hypothetical protein QXQ46_08045 [Thermoplasmatales archaeon]